MKEWNARWSGETNGTASGTTTGEESDLWEQIGKLLSDIPIPSILEVECGGASARLEISKRNTFMKNGERLPSMYVKEVYNYISCTPSRYEEKYLSCVNPEGNSYKFYRLIPIGTPFTTGVDAEYGSIDTDTCPPRRLQSPYQPYLYWIRYYEKLSKGYVDQTAIRCGAKKSIVSKKPSSHEPKDANERLYKELMDYAHHVVREQLLKPADITRAQVKTARAEFNKLCSMKTWRGFNKHLVSLLSLSPRNIGNRALGNAHLSSLMPTEYSDPNMRQDEMRRIIAREENLLLAMEAIIGTGQDEASPEEADAESFRQYKVHVWEATDEQKKEVFSYLPPELQKKVAKVYRVKPEAQEKAFSRYLKKHHIHKIKKLWHGSVNENWASILQNSLQIRPQAANGRMFGDGLYFAPSPSKSWGYTSYHGTRWARGNSGTAFMGLYATAYGDPWMVTRSGHFTQGQVSAAGHNCVHATASNVGLHADEIIYYDNDAVCLNYLVKFA